MNQAAEFPRGHLWQWAIALVLQAVYYLMLAYGWLSTIDGTGLPPADGSHPAQNGMIIVGVLALMASAGIGVAALRSRQWAILTVEALGTVPIIGMITLGVIGLATAP